MVEGTLMVTSLSVCMSQPIISGTLKRLEKRRNLDVAQFAEKKPDKVWNRGYNFDSEQWGYTIKGQAF